MLNDLLDALPESLAAVEAAEALGAVVEWGPFGSTCSVADHLVEQVTGALMAAAFANGATHVNLHVERSDGSA